MSRIKTVKKLINFEKDNRYLSVGLFFVVASIWILFAYILGTFSLSYVKDELDYIGRGLSIGQRGLEVISDGYRPPLFPLWIGFIHLFIPEEFLLNTIRILNILMVSLIPVLWFRLAQKSIQTDRKNIYLFMALLTAVWPPMYLFSFFALAESGSFLFLNILFITLLGYFNDKTKRDFYLRTILISLTLAILFFLKANNILIAIPIAIFVFFTLQSSWKSRIVIISLMTSLTLILITPWIVFVSQSTGKLNISTTGGFNLLVGTGHHYNIMTPDIHGLPYRYMHHNSINSHTDVPIRSILSNEDLNLYQIAHKKVANSTLYTDERAKSRGDFDSTCKKIGIKIWVENTQEQVTHGVLKIIHSYGGSFRGIKDYITIGFLLIVFLASVSLWKKSTHKSIIMLHWGFVLSGFLIVFFFLTNMRFKTFYFDTTGLFILAIYFSTLLGKFRNKREFDGE